MATTNLAEKRDFYTYEDYRGFPDDLRCEIIEGQIFDMTPAPMTGHQAVVREISGRLWLHLREKERGPCQMFSAPTDVVFSEKDIVQPDVLIVCDPSRIRRKGIFGAPDAVFEVISPRTEVKDRKSKRDLYERHGVKEYFLAHPELKYVEKYTLEAGLYKKPELYEGDESFQVVAVGLEIVVKDLFPFQEEKTG